MLKMLYIALVTLLTVVVAVLIIISVTEKEDPITSNILDAPYEIKSTFGTYQVQSYQTENGLLLVQFPTTGTPVAKDFLIIGGNFEIRARTLGE